jgi:hypothetical protein
MIPAAQHFEHLRLTRPAHAIDEAVFSGDPA